jgi:hypothetical protein
LARQAAGIRGDFFAPRNWILHVSLLWLAWLAADYCLLLHAMRPDGQGTWQLAPSTTSTTVAPALLCGSFTLLSVPVGAPGRPPGPHVGSCSVWPR